MNPDLSVAIVSAVGVVVTGMLEVVRRQGKRTAVAVSTPGDHSAGEILAELSTDVKEVQRTLGKHGQRIAVVETRLGDHLAAHSRSA
jgi:transcription antitermination factor NusA-like protein